MSTVAVIQARMGSTRLPGKVLEDVAGEPMLARVVERARGARTLDRVVVATTTAPADDAVAAFCAERGYDIFRGSEDDVLERYHGAAVAFGARTVVRLTADCPLLDPGVIDEVVSVYHAGGYDYVANILECTFPDGLDTEVFSREALGRARGEARLRSEREHVTPYIRNHPELFRHRNVRGDEDWSALRWTVDEPRDLAFVRAVYERMRDREFTWRDVLELVRAEPELGQVNAGIERNEGYRRSLERDTTVDFPEAS